MTPSRTAKASSPAAALPLLLIILIDSMGFAMLTPLLAAELAPDSTSAIGAGLSEDARYIIYGVATGLYPMMMFFGAPILGQLSDRVGRKRMLLICAVGIVLSYTILGAAFSLGSVILVMVGRALGGMTAASQPISLAALVDISAAQKRDFWLSMGLLASSVGFVVGPALSGLLSDSSIVPWFNTQTPLLATVALAAINFFLLFALFRESPRATAAEKRTPLSLLSGLHSLAHAFQRSGLRRVSTVFLLQEMAWGAYFFFIAHFVMDALTPRSRTPVSSWQSWGLDSASALLWRCLF
jgi:MFS transporter, DHA1 family, tetracycline resistance protein